MRMMAINANFLVFVIYLIQVADKEEKMRTSEEEETEKMVRKIFQSIFYLNISL